MTNMFAATWQRISLLGVNTSMPFYLVQKRIVFNRTMAGIMAFSLLHFLYNWYSSNYDWLPVLLPVLSIITAVVAFRFMYMRNFRSAITVLFAAYPVLASAYAVAAGMNVLYISHFILLVLAFYLLRPQRSTIGASVFIFTCFIAGYGYELLKADALTGKLLFYATGMFYLGFIVLHGIRSQVCKYEATLKANNIHLKQVSEKTEKQKKELEQQAVQLKTQTATLAELNEIKTRLFSILSHDLRGHVHALHGAIRVGNESAEGRNFLLQNLNVLEKDAADACNLLEGILGWSKTLLHSAEPLIEPVDVGHLVQAVAKFYEGTAAKTGVFFKLQLDRNLTASCDRNMMETVFRNIINNAVKFSNAGQPITIKSRQQGNQLCISVTDQGKGMQPQQLERILDYSGNCDEFGLYANGGIGLVLTKELLQKNGGSLHIHSQEGKGTTVEVQLPLQPVIAGPRVALCAN